jgi:hypothetical protein
MVILSIDISRTIDKNDGLFYAPVAVAITWFMITAAYDFAGQLEPGKKIPYSACHVNKEKVL